MFELTEISIIKSSIDSTAIPKFARKFHRIEVIIVPAPSVEARNQVPDVIIALDSQGCMLWIWDEEIGLKSDPWMASWTLHRIQEVSGKIFG
jgi:hypothetical protein